MRKIILFGFCVLVSIFFSCRENDEIQEMQQEIDQSAPFFEADVKKFFSNPRERVWIALKINSGDADIQSLGFYKDGQLVAADSLEFIDENPGPIKKLPGKDSIVFSMRNGAYWSDTIHYTLVLTDENGIQDGLHLYLYTPAPEFSLDVDTTYKYSDRGDAVSFRVGGSRGPRSRLYALELRNDGVLLDTSKFNIKNAADINPIVFSERATKEAFELILELSGGQDLGDLSNYEILLRDEEGNVLKEELIVQTSRAPFIHVDPDTARSAVDSFIEFNISMEKGDSPLKEFIFITSLTVVYLTDTASNEINFGIIPLNATDEEEIKIKGMVRTFDGDQEKFLTVIAKDEYGLTNDTHAVILRD